MLAVVATVSCVPLQPPVYFSTPFDANEVSWSKDSGTAVIEGQAFLKTRGGDVKYGAGNTVLLMPQSAYFTAWYTTNKGFQEIKVGFDASAKEYVRQTTSGGDGKFKFSDLPAGKYYIVTTVTWEVPQQGNVPSVVENQANALG